MSRMNAQPAEQMRGCLVRRELEHNAVGSDLNRRRRADHVDAHIAAEPHRLHLRIRVIGERHRAIRGERGDGAHGNFDGRPRGRPGPHE